MRHVENKKQNRQIQLYNDIKCKWTKQSNQKSEVRLDKKYIWDPAIWSV